MITITELELVLFIGFAVMTFLYFKARGEVSMHRRDGGFELEPTAKAKT